MLSINDLKNKTTILIDEQPYQVLEVKHLHMGRGGSSVQTRIRNLVTGQVFSRNFKPADTFEEAKLDKCDLTYLYNHRGEFVFAAKDKPSERFTLDTDHIGDAALWLKPNTVVNAMFLDGKLLTITLPIKMELKVTEAPPGTKGDTATGGTKTVVLETGAKIQTPLFIQVGDVIRINTETGEYAERVSKASVNE